MPQDYLFWQIMIYYYSGLSDGIVNLKFIYFSVLARIPKISVASQLSQPELLFFVDWLIERESEAILTS